MSVLRRAARAHRTYVAGAPPAGTGTTGPSPTGGTVARSTRRRRPPVGSVHLPSRVAFALAVVLLTGLFGLTAPAAPAQAARADVSITVEPSTVQAGHRVGLKAGCGDDRKPATVRSRAFDEVTLVPGGEWQTGSATVPADTRAGDYRVKLRCASGGSATTELIVLNMATPTRGPDTGGGGTAGGGDPPGSSLLLAGVGAASFAGAGLLFARRWRRAG